MVSTIFVASLARDIFYYYYTCIQFPKRSTKYNYLHKNNFSIGKVYHFYSGVWAPLEDVWLCALFSVGTLCESASDALLRDTLHQRH